ncbi:MAG: regulatory iron-sulfur-containing complex subunit RicT [candidate division Zixibacteria bacterium]|nr:regulatory iron-sulfur-containing complex subunit RicT [candidate division Zixibacteria bacterium]
MELYIIEFKGSRREYFSNPGNLTLSPGDYVIVQAERGEDLGEVSKKIEAEDSLKLEETPMNILRPATQEDRGRMKENQEKGEKALEECQRLIQERNLEMKLVDVEYQFDGSKLTFFFIAEKRIDFRELVKELASIYRTRIELRQIGVRDEAKRLGGYGCCGLKLCCTTFIREFSPITTQLAKEQNLALNPVKLSGNCGRLLCCLLYEKDFYEKNFKLYPRIGSKYRTEKGEGVVEKVNLFKEYIVVRHEEGEIEKISLTEIKKRKKKSQGVTEF